MDYSEGGEVGGVDGAAAVVGEALVALSALVGIVSMWEVYGVVYWKVVEPVCLHVERRDRCW